MEALSRRALFGVGLARLVPEQLTAPEVPEEVGPPAVDWSDGDEDALLRWLEPAADELVDAAGVAAGHDVLDVAAGEGNVALAAARRGARVAACDVRGDALRRAAARADAAGVDVDWIEADAQALPFEGARFDRVLSGFGAIHAPAAETVARELRRVSRPDGLVAMTAWASASFMGAALDSAALRLGCLAESPARWGRYETVYLLFDGASRPLDVDERVLPLEAGGADDVWRFLESTPGPVAAAARNVPESEREELRAEVVAAAAKLPRGGAGLEIPYTLTVAR